MISLVIVVVYNVYAMYKVEKCTTTHRSKILFVVNFKKLEDT